MILLPMIIRRTRAKNLLKTLKSFKTTHHYEVSSKHQANTATLRSENIDNTIMSDNFLDEFRELPKHLQDDVLTSWEHRDEMGYIIIQFGFISFFSCAFPLAPLFAYLYNVLEVRFGSYRLLESRRPFPERAQGVSFFNCP
jgi:hypothetical protein